MDTDIPQILCTKMDEHAGAWPSESFVSLFRIARKCVEPKMHNRPEIHQVCVAFSVQASCHIPLFLLGVPRAERASDTQCPTVFQAGKVQED